MEIIENRDGSIGYKEKVYLPNGRTATKTFSRKTDARDWKRQRRLENQKNEALGIDALRDNLLFAEIFELWMQMKIRPIRSPKTVADYESIGRKHLKKYFGANRIRSINRSHGDKLIQTLKDRGLLNKTANKILTVFKQVVGFAETQGFVIRSPLRNFPMLPAHRGRLDYLTHQEVLQLLRGNSTERIYPLLLVALNTGMRIGEITGLCWDRVSFENETIEISRSMTRRGLKESTKTNLVRYVPMNHEVKSTLFELMRKQIGPKFVFTDSNGEHFNPDHFSKRHFAKALRKAGVREITFHVLRHTYASQYMMNGGNVFDLQKILGHTKVDMTMIYAHLSPQHLRKAVDTVRFSAEGNMSNSPFVALRDLNAENATV